MPFFTYPLAWIAAITLPALVAIYFLRHRFRKQSVSTLLLWQMHRESREGGRRIGCGRRRIAPSPTAAARRQQQRKQDG